MSVFREKDLVIEEKEKTIGNGLSTRFRALVAPVAIGLSMLASPAFAEDAANSNVPVTNASISSTVPQKAQFASWDERTKSVDFVQTRAAIASSNKPVIIVWGGSQEAMKNAYMTAKELNNQGMAIGIVLGPNRQTGEFQYDVEIEVYAGGGSAFGGVMQYGGARIDEIGEDVTSKVKAAQARYFPQQIAQLNLR